MSLFFTISSCAHKTRTNSRHGRRRPSSMPTIQFLLNVASTQIMTEHACVFCSNWSDLVPIRGPLCTKSSSNSSRAQASHWITVMRRPRLRLTRVQCCMKQMRREKMQVKKREERWPWTHHQDGRRDVTRSHRCTMSQLRLSGSQGEEPCPVHLPHTLKWRNHPSTEDL